MTKISMKDISPELTAEEIMELEAAEHRPITPDDDCPEMTVSRLMEFKPFHQKKEET